MAHNGMAQTNQLLRSSTRTRLDLRKVLTGAGQRAQIEINEKAGVKVATPHNSSACGPCACEECCFFLLQVGYTTSIKYQAPGEDLSPNELVSISGDDDLAVRGGHKWHAQYCTITRPTLHCTVSYRCIRLSNAAYGHAVHGRAGNQALGGVPACMQAAFSGGLNFAWARMHAHVPRPRHRTAPSGAPRRVPAGGKPPRHAREDLPRQNLPVPGPAR